LEGTTSPPQRVCPNVLDHSPSAKLSLFHYLEETSQMSVQFPEQKSNAFAILNLGGRGK